MDWAIVIGVDEYGSDALRLTGAVSDAERFHEWVVAPGGGNVPRENVRLLLGRRADDPRRSDDDVVPTKDNVVTAINEVIMRAPVGGDRLFFFFAGHGLTARVSNRDESALVTPGFSELHPDHSLAVRSLTEHFETTPFADQFFFLDACRDIPWAEREFEIGRWPIPRRRDPGKPPVQQFVLYATSPGLTAAEAGGWVEEASGAFTSVLMQALDGKDLAKAWSWERNCYEVRWERLARFVNERMKERRERTKSPPGVPPGEWPIQIPQDTGARGVADRDRDALLVSFPSGHFPSLALALELKADLEYEEAEVSVLDALGSPIVSALKVTGTEHTFKLPPRTYAVRATTTAPEERFGTLRAPIELYADSKETVELRPRPPVGGEVSEAVREGDLETAGQDEPPGVIEVRARDPLAVAEVRDEAGRVVAVLRGGERCETKPGFYRVRQAGPEEAGSEWFVVLSAGEREEVQLAGPKPIPLAAALAESFGGAAGEEDVTPVAGATPVASARPSTVVAAAVGAALHGDRRALAGLGLDDLPASLREGGSAVALCAVATEGDLPVLTHLASRAWPAGDPVGDELTRLAPSEAGVASVVTEAAEPGPFWLSVETDDAAPTVVALPVLPGRLATVVAELGPDRMRLYQFHPVAGAHACSTPDRLRAQEHLQRLLLGGRLDGARALAEELAATAAEDPFAGCLAGYVLLRLGLHAPLADLVARIVEVAPTLSDAFVLRGEYEAARERPEAAAQAFADAVAAGVPAFGEGLTRLVEGLRASAFVHPRGALVRHLFQRHSRGTMWAAFTPRRPLEPGRLVISGADIGYEG